MKVLRESKGMLSATIREIDHDGKTVVEKEFRGTDFFTRLIFGPFMLRREEKALRRLEGMAGIPKVFGRSKEGGLLLERVDGKPMKSYQAGELPDSFLEKLIALVSRMHERGVVHLDLRHNKNILVTSDGDPLLLDFANAFRWNVLLFPLWGIFKKVDRGAILKQKRRNFPHLLTEDEKKALGRHRFFRRLWIFTKPGRHSR
ncbi:MAG: hypothetical protein QF645_02000 [Planctomycetota bacterium]|nr:hypothetical protein [Planctomycetota bacterium]